MSNNNLDFSVQRIGECKIPSPMNSARFVSDDARVPNSMPVSRRKQVNPESRLWSQVLACTGQPAGM